MSTNQSAKKVISFTVAECSEFHNIGEFHEGIGTVNEAIEKFKAIPPERMNGIPAIGICISDGKNEMNNLEMDILVGNKLDMEMLSYVPDIAENWKAQQAIATIIHEFPKAEIRGEIPKDIQKKVQWIESKEKRNDELQGIMEKLEKGVQDVFESDNYKKLLNVMSQLPHYSVNNQILIMLQNPKASMCNSFTGWKKQNRYVKAGEKGLRILAPAPYQVEREQEKRDQNNQVVRDKDGEPVMEKVKITINSFKPVSTFDISQTDGEPLPQLGVKELLGSVEGYEILLDAIKQASPVPISFEQIDSGAKGYFHVEENRIAIQEGMSEAQTIKTLLHETSHATLHSKEAVEANKEKKSRSQKECEAESVAYVVSQHYGVDTSEYSFGYVAGWSSDQDTPELKASLNIIRKASSELITKIDEIIADRSSFKDIDEFLEVHGDELPFVDTEVDRPVGYIEIVPPVDIKDLGLDKKPEMEASKEKTGKKEIKKEAQEKDSGERTSKPSKNAKKKSVKSQISEKKETVAKTSKAKKAEKNLGEAI